jgi:hypothetical protein
VGLTAGGSLLASGGVLPLVGVVLSVAGFAAIASGSRRVLPAGTLRLAHGIPAVTAMRGIIAAAFGIVGSFIPLMLSAVHGLGPAAAGVSLTITGVFWATGSQLHGLNAVQAKVPPAARLRIAFSLITIGITGPALLALSAVPLWAGLALWAVAGLGMGIGSPTLSTQLLALSPESDQGRNTAASMLTGSVAQAIALSGAGAAIAWAEPDLPGWLFAGIMLSGSAIAAVGTVVAPRAAGSYSTRSSSRSAASPMSVR